MCVDGEIETEGESCFNGECVCVCERERKREWYGGRERRVKMGLTQFKLRTSFFPIS